MPADDQTVFWCTACGFKLKGAEKYCPSCGVYLIREGDKIECKKCGAQITGNFCAKCGSPAIVDEKKLQKKSFAEKTFTTLIGGLSKLVDGILDAIFSAFR